MRMLILICILLPAIFYMLDVFDDNTNVDVITTNPGLILILILTLILILILILIRVVRVLVIPIIILMLILTVITTVSSPTQQDHTQNPKSYITPIYSYITLYITVEGCSPTMQDHNTYFFAAASGRGCFAGFLGLQELLSDLCDLWIVIRWILQILHDHKYLTPWELWYCSI